MLGYAQHAPNSNIICVNSTFWVSSFQCYEQLAEQWQCALSFFYFLSTDVFLFVIKALSIINEIGGMILAKYARQPVPVYSENDEDFRQRQASYFVLDSCFPVVIQSDFSMVSKYQCRHYWQNTVLVCIGWVMV